MPVSSLPINMSEINAEFGSKSLAQHFIDGDGGVGSLPGNMSEFAGLSDLPTPVSVTMSNKSNSLTDYGPLGATLTVDAYPDEDPADTGSDYSYEYTRLSGSSGITKTSDLINGGARFSGYVSCPTGGSDSITSTWRVRVYNDAGSVEDTFTVTFSCNSLGS